MPLPPALAKRLAARGLVNKKTLQQQSKRGQQPLHPIHHRVHFLIFSAEPEEEVFAESYDDQDDSSKARKANPGQVLSFPPAGAPDKDNDKSRFLGFPGCPNKWCVYHECLPWCHQKWGQGAKEPDAKYLRLFQVSYYGLANRESGHGQTFNFLIAGNDEDLRAAARGVGGAVRPRKREAFLLEP